MERFEGLTQDFFSFIETYKHSDPAKLLMKYSGKELGFCLPFAVDQILCRKKAAKKIPTFLSDIRFLFPDLISSEQATDEVVAGFHANLVGDNKRIVDLTTGLGIDAFSMARNGNEVTAIEIDSNKANALSHNAEIQKLKNFNIINEDCRDYIKEKDPKPDYFFIDPARRDETNSRTYNLKDCTPDITIFYKDLIKDGATLYIKASPLLDISATVKGFENLKSIYIVCLKGECKEILLELNKSHTEGTLIHAVDIDREKIRSRFSVKWGDEHPDEIIASVEELKPHCFLYEPNAAVMKLHAGGLICERFKGIKKLGRNTELFISESLYDDFPGRIVEIERVLSSKEIKKIKGENYSVVTRNYPLKASELKKKIGVGESDEMFLYAMRVGEEEKPMIIISKKRM